VENFEKMFDISKKEEYNRKSKEGILWKEE